MTRPFHLLALYAHPDDESFGAAGTIATVTGGGGRVTLVCATRGEAGEISDPSLATTETIGEVRERELRTAMAMLNVADVRLLGYRDSGMAGTAANDDPLSFLRASAAGVTKQYLKIMLDIRPDVVLTFGADGVYGHPDHIKAHQTATAAFERYLKQTENAPALYYNAVPKSRIHEMAKRPSGPFRTMSPEELDRCGTPDELITTVIDVSHQFERKLATIRAHRTQVAPDGPWGDLPAETVRSLMQFERFRLIENGERAAGIDPLLAFATKATIPPVSA